MSFIPEAALLRGRAVHKATELDDRGDLDEASVDPAVRPFFESYRLYRAAHPEMAILEIEREVVHQPMGFMGHLDRVVQFGAGPRVVVDLKCGAHQRWHGVQTALYAIGYAHAAEVETPTRGGLYLQGDGSEALWRDHGDPNDFSVAKAVVTVAHFVSAKSRERTKAAWEATSALGVDGVQVT